MCVSARAPVQPLNFKSYPITGLNRPLGSKSLVKCALVQALRLCTGLTAHRASREIALLFHDYSTRRGWEVSVTTRPLFTPRKDPVTIVQETGWAPGPVWTGAENLAPPPGFDSRTVQPAAIRYTDYAIRPSKRLRLLEFLDSRHMWVARLSALRTGCLYPLEISLPRAIVRPVGFSQ
jgi:hypothetical protein